MLEAHPAHGEADVSSPEASSLGRWGTLSELVAAKHEEVGKGPDLGVENVGAPQAEAAQQKTRAGSKQAASSEDDTDEEEERRAKKSRRGRSARRQLDLGGYLFTDR